MGNSLSAEAPWRGQRTSQKLSKPKTGNPTAAGLLNHNGVFNPARSPPAARRLSLPNAPTPVPLPDLPEADHDVTTSNLGAKKEGETGSRLSRLFRSNTSKEVPRYRQRSSSIVSGSQQGHWSSRANSVRNGSQEVLNHGHVPQGTMPINGSRTSFNHDTGLYDAQRLLNLVEVPSHKSNSVTSETHIHISEAMREDSKGRRPSIPSIPDTNASLPRANSDVSLYAPMRRRSLMTTPGVATRDVRLEPNSSRGRTRHSVPSTPSRRESMESMRVERINFPPPLTNPDPIPRAHTPCEAEYKQTGAFKLGTLRITNGSPARSPARIPNEAIQHERDYFATVQMAPNGSTELGPSNIVEKVWSPTIANPEETTQLTCPDTIVLETVSQLPADHQLNQPLLDDGKLKVPLIQVTSKHTALEDELFDDDLNEYSFVEILDVRVDANAKSLPGQPKLTAGRRNSKDINRSDSGIASPASECSQPRLSKADSGYSSSASLRSFSSRPPVPEKDRNLDIDVEDISAQQSVGSRDSDVLSSTITMASANISETVRRASPPPVPAKDPHHISLTSPTASGELSPSFQRNFSLSSGSNHGQMLQRVLSTTNSTRNQANAVGPHRASLLNPTAIQSNNSTLSISTGFRKSGRLQRFLSGGRTSLIVHDTHPTENASVPAVSRDMQVKLQSHSGRLPRSSRRLALKSAASKETLGTILSVGSLEMLLDDDIPTSDPSGQLISDGKGAPVSIKLAISNTTSPTFSKRPIPRKPVPIRNKEHSAREPAKTQRITGRVYRENSTQASPWNSTSGAIYSSSLPARGDERVRHSVPAIRLTRSNTMSGHAKDDGRLAYAGNRHSHDFGQGKSHSTTSLELPPASSRARLSKSPPVSMRTRNMGSLRLPPPRSQSTPPENMKQPSRPGFSRRGSRDGNSTIPEVTGTFLPNHPVMSKRSSRESFHNYPPAHPHRSASTPPTSAANNLQPLEPRTSVGTLSRRPSWDVPVNHGPSLSRRPSSENFSRRSSLASQSSHRSSATAGPGLPRQPYHSQPDLPSLQRRSSYDNYNLIPQDSGIRDNGPYPSISRDGQSYVSDPWSGRSMSMPQQWEQQWDQLAQYPPHAPRHHYRQQSLDKNGNPAPYRVLHSYHSPAYKHVPIWG
ncbi:hypothetical protein GGR53DRAFT_528750 [Hypoxylon sp. FL1150]|nr:hypothetical protein GGR53DRAFT_528750 [Hypoxylon sp. FL1150]